MEQRFIGNNSKNCRDNGRTYIGPPESKGLGNMLQLVQKTAQWPPVVPPNFTGQHHVGVPPL